jgi:hypothetical protein
MYCILRCLLSYCFKIVEICYIIIFCCELEFWINWIVDVPNCIKRMWDKFV